MSSLGNNTTMMDPDLSVNDFIMYVTMIVLSLVGMVLNGFSIYVLWKCITTGELGIKLVLFNDFSVCFGYMIAYIINLSLGNSDNISLICTFSTISRVIILFTLFVSNWWIVILLILRLLMLFRPISVNKWNKPLYHKLSYLVCVLSGVVLVSVLSKFKSYSVKILVILIPPILVALEAGFIVFYCCRLNKNSKQSANNNATINNDNQRCSTSSSNFTMARKDNAPNNQSIIYKQIGSRKHKPYNHIVITILALAFNFLLMDTLQFIDVMYYLLSKTAFPKWIMMIINITSILKRIFNFIILCFKCPHFRKIMNLKLNLILRIIRRRHATLRHKPSHNVNIPNPDHHQTKHCLLNDSAVYCDQCQDHFLFIKGGDVIFNNTNGNAMHPNNPMSPGNNTSTIPITSYCSVFEVVPQFMSSSQNTLAYCPNRLVISNNY